MTCHESLMAKRRKHKKQRAANNMNKDKSLPDLPQDMSSMSSMPDNVFELATPANEPTLDPVEQADTDRRSSRRRGESKDFGLRDSTAGAQSGKGMGHTTGADLQCGARLISSQIHSPRR